MKYCKTIWVFFLLSLFFKQHTLQEIKLNSLYFRNISPSHMGASKPETINTPTAGTRAKAKGCEGGKAGKSLPCQYYFQIKRGKTWYHTHTHTPAFTITLKYQQ